MGRHRRSAAGRAAKGRATGATQREGSYAEHRTPGDSAGGDTAPMGIAPYLNPQAYAEAVAKSQAYLFATDDSSRGGGPRTGFAPDAGAPRGGGRRRRRRAVTPVRTGLLGVAGAVAIGTVAVASGVVPGLHNYRLGGSAGGDGGVQAADAPTNSPSEQGGTSGNAEAGDRSGPVTGRTPGRSTSAPASASASTSAPASVSPSPSASPSTASPSPTPTPSKTATKKPSAAPHTTAPSRKAAPTKAPERTSAPPVTVPAQARAEAEVLRLVNEERAKAGLAPLAANSALTGLAENFSDDMAARGFFDHTDPDGHTPWDRAAKAGITGLGGENIARGQADPAAVVAAWMDSPGHRANILNPDFKTLGVGVHLGAGGPWWTQDFGF
ncbi:CAP domain-containing protein [Streptomyces sp. NPDC014006]|uniref:CAP domain-containing protein n=1 Tax=Streptomyces sp. NPDC014006 TaxID=3364870 RepID=UPI003700586A